jgi:copper chaperone CopZ
MRQLLFILFLFAEISSVNGQIKHASIQAAGLTCAMCSNAIYRSLSALPFIEEVTPDVEHSSFFIHFKSDKDIHPEAMRAAVEEAGFSVAQFSISIRYNQIVMPSNKNLKIKNMTLNVINGEGVSLEQDVEFIFLDQGFLTDKRRKELEKDLGVDLRKKKKMKEPDIFTVMIKKDE